MSATITCTLCGYHGPKHDVFGQECMRATTERIYRLTEERDHWKAGHDNMVAVKARGRERMKAHYEAALAAKDDALRGLLSANDKTWNAAADAARTALGATEEAE